MQIFTRTPNFSILPRCLSLSSSRLYSRTSQYPRAPNFFSVPRLCTIQNNSNSFAKTHLRTSFFIEQLPIAAFKCKLFFLKREKQKQIFMLPLSLIRSKFCNCIKIKTLFIHNSEKTTRIYPPIF